MKLNEIVNATNPIEALKQFALDNYDQGGDEAYETFEDTDYAKYLEQAGGNLDKAKQLLKQWWTLVQDVGDDIRGS